MVMLTNGTGEPFGALPWLLYINACVYLCSEFLGSLSYCFRGLDIMAAGSATSLWSVGFRLF